MTERHTYRDEVLKAIHRSAYGEIQIAKPPLWVPNPSTPFGISKI